MELAFSEMPLALFTTFASLGAGAFAVLAVVLLATKLEDGALARIDRLTAVPLVLALVGFVCAFFHLANPAGAFGVFAGAGASPLSNEIVAGCVFVVVAIVYTVLAAMGKLSGGARRGFAGVAAVFAVVFALMMGMAYMMDTIASWNTPASPLQMLGFALVGGAAVATLMLALAGVDGAAVGAKTPLAVLAVAGAVLGVGALAAQAAGVSGMENALASGAEAVGAAMPCLAAAVVALAASCVCTVLAARGKSAVALSVAGTVLAFAGVLCARLAFYAMQVSVGLCVL